MSLGSIVSSIFGGGGGGGQTTSTTNTSNIPEYARPYVENMLGATQNQLFNIDANNQITGFKPYQAYGGTYDEQGNQLSYDPSKAIAGFSPMQAQAQQGIAGMQTPGEYGAAKGVTGAGIMNAARLGSSANPQDFQSQVGGYMNPYMQQVLDPQMAELRRQYGISGVQQQGAATQAGAFGGSREAIMNAENQRNLMNAQNQAIGNAYNQAFGAAQNQYNQGQGFQLQANQAAMQGAGQLAGLGQQELAAQQGIYGLQNQTGAQQQALEQAKINQAMTDYANAQQYPLMQLGTMSNMLRGLPMQASTTNQYAAAPSALSQGIGAAGAYAGLTQAGVIPKAEGGLASVPRYDVGGAVEADLEDMDIDGLQRQIKESSSPRVKQMAQRILAEKRMATQRMAGGGIIAFSKGNEVEDKEYPDTDVSLRDTVPNVKTPMARLGQSLRNAFAVKTPEKMRFEEIDEKIIPKKEEAITDKRKGITEAPVAKERAAPVEPPAAEYKQPGILGAATAGTLGPNPKIKPDEFMAPMIKERDRYAKLAAEDESVAAKRMEDEAGPNVARDTYRAERMAERANLKDEAERQRGMRLAEFFASWGSTPGPVLIAGMTALKKSIPGMVEDTKEAKKLQRESDKIIYDIDEATRLDKAGFRDKARAMIQQAATNASHLNSNIAHYASTSKSAEASMANAAAQREATSANKAIAAEENKIKTLLQAQANTTNLLRVHETERKDPEYANASSLAKIGKDENGLDKPLDKIPKELRGQISEARKIVNQYATRHRQELQAARDQEAALSERTPIGKGKGKTDTADNDPFKIR